MRPLPYPPSAHRISLGVTVASACGLATVLALLSDQLGTEPLLPLQLALALFACALLALVLNRWRPTASHAGWCSH